MSSSDTSDQIEADVEAGIEAGKKRQLWMVGLVLVAILALVGGGLLIQRSRPAVEAGALPRRVITLLEGFDDVRVEPLNRALDELLLSRGLQSLVPRPAPPTEFSGIAQLEPWMREHDASHVVLVSAEIQEERQGLGEEARFVIVQFTARILSESSEGASSRPPSSVTFAAQGGSVAEVLEMLGAQAIDILSPAIIEALIRSEPIDALIEGGSERQLSLLGKLANSGRIIDEREATLETLDETCRRADEVLLASGAAGERCLTPICGQVMPIGLIPAEGGALVHVKTGLPQVALENTAIVQRVKTLEELQLLSLEGELIKTLAKVESVVGQAQVTADGRIVFFVEGAQSSQGLISIEVATGERRVHKVAQAPEKIDRPSPSPTGRWVAFTQPMDRRNPRRDYLLTVADGQVRELPAGTERVDWITMGDRHLIALTRLGRVGAPLSSQSGSDATPARPPLRRYLAVLDPESLEEIRTVWDEERAISEIAGTRGDEVFFVYRSGRAECGFGLYRWSTNETSYQAAFPCPRNVTLAGDEGMVASALISSAEDEVRRDPELVLIDPNSGLIQAFTTNATAEVLVVGRPGSKRILYSRMMPPAYRGLPRMAVCTSELPPMPEPAPAEEAEK